MQKHTTTVCTLLYTLHATNCTTRSNNPLDFLNQLITDDGALIKLEWLASIFTLVFIIISWQKQACVESSINYQSYFLFFQYHDTWGLIVDFPSVFQRKLPGGLAHFLLMTLCSSAFSVVVPRPLFVLWRHVTTGLLRLKNSVKAEELDLQFHKWPLEAD